MAGKFTFQKANKMQAKARVAFVGPSGSGKTYSALLLAGHLGERVAVIDTERGSASKYADIFDFSVVEFDSFHPQNYIDAIHVAEEAGFDVLVIDSLSHAWMGKDGALQLVDEATKRSRSSNSFAAWREVTPLHNDLVDAMIGANLHLIVTMRSKTEYIIETDSRGKSVPRKVGMAPIQRDGLEYEFDVVGDMDYDNNFIVSKTRCPALRGAVLPLPDDNLAEPYLAWLTAGEYEPSTLERFYRVAGETHGFSREEANDLIRAVKHGASIASLTPDQQNAATRWLQDSETAELREKLAPTAGESEPKQGALLEPDAESAEEAAQ